MCCALGERTWHPLGGVWNIRQSEDCRKDREIARATRPKSERASRHCQTRSRPPHRGGPLSGHFHCRTARTSPHPAPTRKRHGPGGHTAHWQGPTNSKPGPRDPTSHQRACRTNVVISEYVQCRVRCSLYRTMLGRERPSSVCSRSIAVQVMSSARSIL